jgi:hypothetical protein
MSAQALILATALSLTSNLTEEQQSSIHSNWCELANSAGAELLIGDYPYAAWYSQEAFEKKEWEGYWFAHPVKEKGMRLSIYIPHSYSMEAQALSFFHELGHITDKNKGQDFDTTWDNEVSAWVTGRKLMLEHQPNFNQDNMKNNLTGTLSTYLKGSADDTLKWSRALKMIFGD